MLEEHYLSGKEAKKIKGGKTTFLKSHIPSYM